MVIPLVDKKLRNLQRYHQILNILVKHGFGYILDRMNISTYFQMGKKILLRRGEPRPGLTLPEEIRVVLEDLGPTFIKLGQLLSTRPFLIPPEFIRELSKLQDKVKPAPFETIRPVIEKELNGKLEETFSWFDEHCIAAASIAQAYKAKTKDGSDVVVKVQRPGIKRIVETDMAILRDLAHLLEKHIPESVQYDPLGIVEELSRTMSQELDFTTEARNIEQFANNFADDPTIYVMKVFWNYTTDKILTVEFIKGVKISDINVLKEQGFDLREISRNGARIILKQIFIDGFFHADPHPGNIFILPDNVISMVDFGMVGRLDEELRDYISDLLAAAMQKDVDEILRVFNRLGIVEDLSETVALRRDVYEFLDRYYGVPLFKLNIKTVMDDIFSTLQRNQLRIRADLMLLAKALGTYEEVGRMLDPELDLVAQARPFVRSLMFQKYSPGRQSRSILKLIRDFNNLIRVFPRELEFLIKKIRKGQLTIEFEHRGLDNLVLELERASNRLASSLIIAALILASSFVIRLKLKPLIFDYSVMGIAGFLFAGFLGIWLAIGILRSGKL
jgi:ubiquinone biosynthesis protein